jgi:uncharacterized protein YceK
MQMKPSNKHGPRVIACALISMLTLSGCETIRTAFGGTERVDVNRVACEAFEPIMWSRHDTDETIISIRAHNAAFVELCGARDGER